MHLKRGQFLALKAVTEDIGVRDFNPIHHLKKIKRNNDSDQTQVTQGE